MKEHNPPEMYPQYHNYSHAIEVAAGSRMLFLSGLNGYMPDGKTMPDSFEEQAEIIWQNIGRLLDSAEMTYANIVSLRFYLAKPEYDPKNVELIRKYLGDNHPSRTVICCQLLEPNWKIEVEAVAAA